MSAKNQPDNSLFENLELRDGVLLWRSSGKPAAMKKNNGFVVRYKGVDYAARRIAWFLIHGRWQTGHFTTRSGDALTRENLISVAEANALSRRRRCACCGVSFAAAHASDATKYCSVACSATMRQRRARTGCIACGAPLGNAAGPRCPPCRRQDEMERRLARKYGLSLPAFHGLLVRANYRCEVCGEAPGTGPKVDHDHATGAVRGILCTSCNVGLGHFRDDPARLRQAAAYLERRR